MIGTTIGNYRVLDRIGDGGMGTVYRGVDQMLDREVALKVMKPELSRQAALNERFRQEAQALARLHHPNITTVFGLEQSGSDLVMVMEFVRGETLESIVQRSGRIAWPRACELLAYVADALDHAHDKGVVHRDIKPANVMLTTTGVVKVMDFGIARILGRSRQTRVGAAVGTPMYMSPEQLRGNEVDGRSDLYSLGAVLFELITGRLAFEAESDYELMMKQLNDPPPPVRSLVPEVPDVVDQVIQRAMAKRAEDRFAHARELATVLRAVMTSAPGTTAAPRPAPATRLADVPVPIPGVAVTADLPVDKEVAPTRLASSPVAATRLADAPVPPTRLDAAAGTPAAPGRMRPWEDWRVWAGVAAVLLVATITLRSPDKAPAVEPARRDSTVSPAGGPQQQAVTPVGGTSAPTLPAENQLPPPEQRRAAPVAGDEPAEPVRPAPRRETSRSPAVTRPDPSRQVPAPGREVTSPTPAPVAEPAPPPRPEVRTPREDPPGEEEGPPTGAIAAAISRFADAVGSGNTSLVGSVLQVSNEGEWMDLMREGRLSLAVTSTPDVDVEGSRATARFQAAVNARSAFGANRRRTASFVAELERSGGTWRLRSVRPVGKVDLK